MTQRSSMALAWGGLGLALVAFVSYPFLFVRWPVTRDVPWVNLLLFAVALAMAIIGARRAFRPENSRGKIAGVTAAVLTVAAAVMFTVAVLVGGRQLPASRGAPQIGQKAPEFRLNDTSGKAVSLSELLSTPINGQPPKGVLLVFYRGYW